MTRSFVARDVKPLLEHLTTAGQTTRVDKPWGYELIVNTGLLQLKFIHVDRGEECSLQYHEAKDEVIFIVGGDGHVLEWYQHGRSSGSPIRHLGGSNGVRIRPGVVHRSVGPLDLIEVSTYHPDDVVRLSDRYRRADPPGYSADVAEYGYEGDG